jgi:hypothetical protein
MSIIKIDELMLSKEIIASCSEVHTKHVLSLREQTVMEFLKGKPVGS